MYLIAVFWTFESIGWNPAADPSVGWLVFNYLALKIRCHLELGPCDLESMGSTYIDSSDHDSDILFVGKPSNRNHTYYILLHPISYIR